ncbi:glycosyltransferase family 39 protein [Methylotetracoccus oryzae]|uniref:glycosyltransferase family 39 protein n=1 Tax=Methylotetracoccus oryzae TaxID=1919059 RepID=UPI001118C2E2|nr:glycosyltransferase family 39 protein [Methylotetracoccus oryzae]
MQASGLLVLLPVGFFVLAGNAGRIWVPEQVARDPRQRGLIAAFALTSCWAGLGSVVLSFGHHLARLPVSLWWLAGILALLGFDRLQRKRFRPHASAELPDGERMSTAEKRVTVALMLSAGAALAMGLLYPPNNGDSIIYHLPRQLIWISERTVWPQAMPFPHMSVMPALSEWVSVQLYVLAGSDRLSFLVQWVSYVTCWALLDAILQQDGASRTARLYAVAFFASLPAAFYQASNNKNDLFLTAWLLLLWLVARRCIALRTNGLGASMLAGVSAGCAMLAKGTAVVYLPAIGMVAGLRFIANRARFSAIGGGAFVSAAAVITALHYVPTFVLFASGDTATEGSVLNGRILSASSAVSVLVRNLALQFALPFESWNRTLEATTTAALAFLGQGPSDPDTTFMATRFAVIYTPFLEDSATALIHFALALWLCAGGFLRVHPGPQRCCARESAALFALSLLLFSVVFRWQPWHSRLLIPAVALAAPGIGLMIASWRPRPWPAVAIAALWLWLLPAAANWSRPLAGKVTPWMLDEDGAVGRSGRGANLLPPIGRVLREASVHSVWLDTSTSPMHAALRYLPLSTQYGFPTQGAPRSRFDSVLTNLPDTELSRYTRKLIHGLVPVVDFEGWRLFLRREAYRDLERFGALPPVTGVATVAGLAPMLGPYPEFKLPLFANIGPSGAEFWTLAGTHPDRLEIALARYAGSARFSILVDGAVAGSIAVDGTRPTAAVTLKLGASATPQRIEIRPEQIDQTAAQAADASARLLKIQATPSAGQ